MPKHLTEIDVTGFLTEDQVGAAGGVAGLDGTGKLPSSQLPDIGALTQSMGDARYVRRGDLTISVKDFGALGDSSTDDTNAIKAAISACPRGGTVYFPPGLYRISSPLTLPPRTTLRGGLAAHWPQYSRDTPQVSAGIKALPSFTGTALVKLLDKAQGGWAETYMSEARIFNLTLDGGNFGTNVSGIYSSGQVVDTMLMNVCINNMTGHGLYTDTSGALQPKGWQMHHVAIQSSGGHGYYHTNSGGADFAITDMTYEFCWSGVATLDGWHIEGAISVDLVGCRAEFNKGYGYYLSGSSRVRWLDCDTDRNTKSGWRLESQGSGQRSIIISGCVANRDGANDDVNPGGYAGFDIVGTSTTSHNPVTISGCVVNTNHNDQGGGIYCPDYGLKMTYAPQVSVSGTLLNGTVAAYQDSQGQIVYDNTTRFNVTNPSTGSVTLEKANTLLINGQAGTNRDLIYQTSGGGKRWAFRASSTTESGSNNGTNFNIARYDDTGTVIDTPFTITRSTGTVTLTGALSVGARLALTDATRMGVATLVAGTVTVSTASVTATSRILLTVQTAGGTQGFLRVAARTAGTSFTITSTSSAETSTVAWLLVETS